MPVYGKKVDVECEWCARDFQVRVADRNRGWGRFCSRSCKATHQANSFKFSPRHLKYRMAMEDQL